MRAVVKGKAVQLQAWSGPEGPKKLRFPDFIPKAQDGGNVVSLERRPPLPPRNLRAVVPIQFTGEHSGRTIPFHMLYRVSGSRSTAAITDLHQLVFTHYMGDLHLQGPQVLNFLSHGEAGPVFEIL